jgi:hypothetical protein
MIRRVFLGFCLLALVALSSIWWLPKISGLLAQAPASVCPTDGIIGAPSLASSFVDQVLGYYHSPAAGIGQALYDESQSFCIDDAVALAFFQHESGFGRAGWGAVNHSLGNIRCSSGYSCQGGYRSYATWQDGYTDWFTLMKSLYIDQWHATTVEAIIPHYAPAADHNNEQAYIRAVKASVALWRAGKLA